MYIYYTADYGLVGVVVIKEDIMKKRRLQNKMLLFKNKRSKWLRDYSLCFWNSCIQDDLNKLFAVDNGLFDLSLFLGL